MKDSGCSSAVELAPHVPEVMGSWLFLLSFFFIWYESVINGLPLRGVENIKNANIKSPYEKGPNKKGPNEKKS